MIKIIDAILSIDPNTEVTVRGEDINRITWGDGNPNGITVEQIQAKQAEIQAEHDSKEYARNRATAYASTGDQLDMQYWDSVNDTTTWKDHVASVKDQFPKV
jgi:hypothetical protein